MDIFCKIVNKEAESKIFYEDDLIIGIMDAFPNRPGHALLIPKKHYETIVDTDLEILSHMNEVAKKYISKMVNSYPECDGVEVIINYGKPQMVKHLHMHLLPTFSKDVNLSQDEACNILKK